jgi:hypothetical protein
MLVLAIVGITGDGCTCFVTILTAMASLHLENSCVLLCVSSNAKRDRKAEHNALV